MKGELIATLRAVVGASSVLTHEDPGADLTAWERDWRGLRRGRALAVVRPRSTEQVAGVVRACARAGVSIVPQGGNTGLVVGSTPDASGDQVVLSLRDMNRIRRFDSVNASMTVEAGCILQNLQEHCDQEGFLFPLSLGAEGSCTIGGNLATNAGGTQVIRFGNARDLCLGLEVVTADGEIWSDLSGLRKNNTGYDLRNLFVGSEGTLGIITAATLKVYASPAAVVTAFVAVPTPDSATGLLKLAGRHLGSSLTGFELMNQAALGLVAKHYPHQQVPLWQATPYCVLLEVSDHESEAHARALLEEMLGVALEAEVVTDAVIAESIAQSRALWHVRESISLAQADEGAHLKHDISLPISSIPQFISDMERKLADLSPEIRVIDFGHLGDGNLHFNVQAAETDREGIALQKLQGEITHLVYEEVARFDGSFSAEHGVGSLKTGELRNYKPASALSLMAKLKAALDPLNMLNPGCILGAR